MGDRTVFAAVAQHAQNTPHAPALTGMGRSWTYSELSDQAERVACGLVHAGAQRGAKAAIVADNHPLSCLVYLAAARVGVVVSLVNSMFKVEELAAVFGKLEPAVVVCDPAHLAVTRAALARLGLGPQLVLLEHDDELQLPSIERWALGERYEGPAPLATDPHEICFTSGTTSTPKGAVLTHETALCRADQEVALLGLSCTDAACVITPLFHQSGIRNTVLVMWACGGHAIVTPRFQAATFWPVVARHHVTYVCMVETILLMLDRQAPCEEERTNTLRLMHAASDPEVIRRCEQRFGVRVVQVWGMTEVGVAVGVPPSLSLEEVIALRTWGKGACLAGWPLAPDTTIRLVQDGKVVTGERATGEIQIRSRTLLREYYNDPEATAAAYQDGWFRAGDLGMYGPDGALYFIDRIKDVIRRGGENIASKEVEDVLNAHPKVRVAAVIPVADPLFMQEVKAVIVANDEVPPDELWSWCEERLARYKVPRYIEFRQVLPLSSAGRIQKQVLREEGVTGHGITHDRRAAGAVHD